MSTPFLAVCPGCSAKLKLKAAPAAGKKLKCPKCERVFAPKVPKPAANEELDAWDLPDESSQPDVGDDEDLDEGDAPVDQSGYVPSRSRSRQTPGKKRSGKKGNSGSGEFPTKILVGVVGVAVLIFGGFLASGPVFNALKGIFAPSVDPAHFIAGNLGVAIQLEPQRLLAIPDLPPAWRQGPDFDKANVDLKAQLGVEIRDVEVVRIVIPIPSGPPQPGASPGDQMRGELVLSKPPVFPANQTPTVIEGIPCYSDPAGKANVIYCAGAKNTILFAQEQTMRACLGAWKRGEARPPKPDLRSTLLSVSMMTAPLSEPISQLQSSPFAAGNPMMPLLQSLKTNVRSVSVAIGPVLINKGEPEESRFSVQFLSEDDAKAEAFAKTLEEALATAAAQLSNPLMGVMLGDKADFAKSIVSAKPFTIGRSTSIWVPLPPEFMKQVAQSIPGLPGAGNSGLPAFPGSPLPLSADGNGAPPLGSEGASPTVTPTSTASPSPPGTPATPLQPIPPQ